MEGGLLETEGFLEGGGLFNLAKMVVLALHKELERKVEKLKYKKLKVMRPRIKSKSNLLTRKYTIQDQSKWSFTVMIDLYSLSLFGEE